MRKKKLAFILVTAVLFMVTSTAMAAEKVKLGIVYPITGPLTETGKLYVDAYKLYVNMINNSYDIDSPGDIIRSKGLPNLGGVNVELVIADTEGKPDIGRSETERLVTVEKVDLVMGAFQSAVTDTTSQVTERYGIPYVNPASSSPKLTNRGFKWFFRTGPDEWSYVGSIMDFLKEFSEKHKDLQIKTIGIVAEDTLWGQDSAMVVKKKAPELGFEVVLDIAYPHEATDVEAEVLRVKRANPDVLIMASYIADALLFQKNYKKYDVNIPILANGTGHIRPQFVQTLGSDVNYVMARQTWADVIIKGNPIAQKIHAELKKAYGEASGLSDIAARTYIGFMTLMEAVNRAGSKEPAAVQKALMETNIPGKLLALPWDGVKFDAETHQNIYSRVMIIQYQDQVQKVIWPWNMAETEVVWKLPPWSQR
jgi:branched-chain amino acid transport system substrate-binding protein